MTSRYVSVHYYCEVDLSIRYRSSINIKKNIIPLKYTVHSLSLIILVN